MNKITWKLCFTVGASIFLLFLAIHYWQTLAELVGMLLSAAVPVFFGMGLAYVLNLLMMLFERFLFPKTQKKALVRLRRTLSVILSFVTLFGIITALIWLVIPQLVQCITVLVEQLPEVFRQVGAFLERSAFLSENVLPALRNLNWQSFLGQFLDILSGGISGVFFVLTGVVSGTITAFLSLIFAGFLLASKEKLLSQSRRIFSLCLPHKIYAKLHYFFNVMNHSFRRYLVGQCTEAVILGVLCAVGMLLLGLPYAAMISTLIAFTALIPVAGAYIGAIVGAVMILTESPLKALIFLVFIVVLQQIEGNLIYPKVVGSSLGLPGFWVLMAVTVGGSMFGILGMLLGVPFTAGIYRIVRAHLRRRETERSCQRDECGTKKEEPEQGATKP